MKKELNYNLRRQSGGSGFFCDIAIIIKPNSDLKNHVVKDISIDYYGNKIHNRDLSQALFYQKQQTILNWQPYNWHSDWTDNYAELRLFRKNSNIKTCTISP